MNNKELYQSVDQVSANSEEVFNLAKADMNLFASLSLPLVTEYAYPDIYVEIWGILIEHAIKHRDFSKFAIGLPRGFAKTSVVKLLIAYCIIFTNKNHFCVLASTATHAQNIVTDICSILDEPNVVKLFGNWRNNLLIDNKEIKKFAFRGRTVIITAIGQGGSVRGLNIDNKRPDFMLFDDIQTREDADSEIASNAIEQWMLGTAMKAASHTGCLYVFLANMYPTKYSILRKLKSNPQWLKIIVGGILADGSSLWEELKPIKQLIAEYETDRDSGHPEIFYAEVLNDEEANINNTIDISKIPAYPFSDDELSAGNFIIIDPSNDKYNSDAVTITLNSIIDTKPVVMEVHEGRFSPEEIIKISLRLAISSGATLIAVEANAFQYSLLYWFNKYITKYELYEIAVRPVYSGHRSKITRILEMFKALLAGEIIMHPNAYAQIAAQIISFNPTKNNNVDGILDCVTYIPRVLTEFKEFIRTPALAAVFNEQGTSEVLEVWDTCNF